MRRVPLIICFLLAIALLLSGHAFYTTKITWSSDVSRVVYRNCVSCHHPGGSAFSLMSYREARPWAEDIKLQVLERRMPPWNAVKGFGEFKDDRGLPQEDLEIIAEWVDGGEPEGNPAYMPRVPDFAANPSVQSRQQDNSHRIHVTGKTVLKRAVSALAVEPQLQGESSVLQAIARFPDGHIEPLIWVEKFNPAYNKSYFLREPLHFPPGTTIEISPPQSGLDLLVMNPASIPKPAH